MIEPAFIIRDPRDAQLSACENGQRMVKTGQTNAFSHIESIDQGIDFIYPYLDFARGWISSTRTFSIYYEDLLLDYQNQAGNLCHYLGIDPSRKQIREVISNYHQESKNKRQTSTHFVNGKIGRHMDIFSETEIQRCDQLSGDFLSDYGYQ